MFMIYRGWGARLLRAMVQLSLDRNADAYEEIRPPTVVRTDTMISTGHLPKFDEEAYHIERDDLWAIPTAEVPLTSLHRDEIVTEAELPLRYAAYTSRSEEHTSELQSLMRNSYAVFCLKKKTQQHTQHIETSLLLRQTQKS